MSSDLPCCPDPLPAHLSSRLAELAGEWAASADRPEPVASILAAWDSTLAAWLKRADLPLLIRKGSAGRGAVRRHDSGRMLVPTDNTPAHWSFALALRGQCPSADDIARAFAQDEIPVAMAFKKVEKAAAKYRGTRGQVDHLNAVGWKLAHITPVALGGIGPLEARSLPTLEQHFLRFMSPRNMFVVPLSWAGLAETDEMADAITAWRRAREAA